MAEKISQSGFQKLNEYMFIVSREALQNRSACALVDESLYRLSSHVSMRY